ncbi:MAG: hypothetical protein ACYC27_21805 [Armatimonadota bacterium]
MKKNLSQKEIILAIIVVFAVIGLVFFMGTLPGGKKAVQIEEQIALSRARVDGSMPASFPKANGNAKTSP